MKRGLKVSDIQELIEWDRVATIAPMKRGLKDDVTSKARILDSVATIAPMKRGLKVQICRRFHTDNQRSNHCPDEKGTERLVPHCPAFLSAM